LIDDPRFARGYPRYLNRHELQQIMEGAFRALQSVEALERLREHDVPASLVQDYAALAEQDQPWANGYLAKQNHPVFGEQRIVGLHIELSETPGAPGAAAPDLGAHTEDVLRELGVTEEQIAELRREGAIAPATG